MEAMRYDHARMADHVAAQAGLVAHLNDLQQQALNTLAQRPTSGRTTAPTPTPRPSAKSCRPTSRSSTPSSATAEPSAAPRATRTRRPPPAPPGSSASERNDDAMGAQLSTTSEGLWLTAALSGVTRVPAALRVRPVGDVEAMLASHPGLQGREEAGVCQGRTLDVQEWLSAHWAAATLRCRSGPVSRAIPARRDPGSGPGIPRLPPAPAGPGAMPAWPPRHPPAARARRPEASSHRKAQLSTTALPRWLTAALPWRRRSAQMPTNRAALARSPVSALPEEPPMAPPWRSMVWKTCW